ncbi:pentatricopeptide repeat-containing protein-like [Iris pallida]|uniref:Pentatricopeptide repeat-containing protein-like n=1 Tax=Iris pallida TaxID=29817 RepID=A0AAX6DSK7_IRIPA|nr:pentatricopeptide repeat-containing protein-like [Iris pallida]
MAPDDQRVRSQQPGRRWPAAVRTDEEAGIQLNSETFLAALASCAAAEAIEEGFIHFNSMSKDYGIAPEMEHYVAMIQVLGNSEHLNEAVEYVEKLPFEPSAMIWECLMNLARMQGDLELEDRMEEILVLMDPSKAPAKPNVPLPKPVRRFGINHMLDGKNRLGEFRLPRSLDRSVIPKVKEQTYVPMTLDTCCMISTRRRRSRH